MRKALNPAGVALVVCCVGLLSASTGCVRDDVQADPTDAAQDAEDTEDAQDTEDAEDAAIDACTLLDPKRTNCAPCTGDWKVDGAFTGWDPKTSADGSEWASSPVLKGVYANLLACVRKVDDELVLHVLNDWHLRDDGPICGAMYNIFFFTTGGGKQVWEVRVYGTGEVKVALNGANVTENVAGGHTYGPSPLLDKEHTIFEFSVSGVLPGAWALGAKDPSPAASLGGGTPDKPAGCDDPDAANTAEPTAFTGNVQPDGSMTANVADKPVIFGYAPPGIHKGTVVTLHGSNLGTSGTVVAGGKELNALSWQAHAVAFTAPERPVDGKLVVGLVASAGASNLVTLHYATGCVGAADGTTCDDGWECTASGTCKGGKCAPGKPGTGAACQPVDGKAPPGFPFAKVIECVQPTCKAGTSGACAWLDVAAGANKPCDDGSKCTTDDTCQFGGCFGAPKSVEPGGACDDGKPCTIDDCHKTKGCVHVFAPDDAACNDGDACTAKTACDQGQCGGGVTVKCDDGNTCTDDACDSKSGCKFKDRPAGVICDDGSQCTDKDECDGNGACKGTLKAGALPPGPCVSAKCNPASGKTTFTNLADGGVCDDGDSCTPNSACKDGKCVGTPIKCDDKNPCTADGCDTAAGTCKFVTLPDGMTCTDLNACTTGDQCLEGKCSGADYLSTGQCDDKNP